MASMEEGGDMATTPVQYPRAIWRGEGLPNVGGTLEAGAVRYIVLHVMEGSLSGTDAWFHDPHSQVSSHFGIGRDGTIYQWVALNRVAWAQAAYNDAAISIEHEGYSGETLTDVQLAASLELIAWLCAALPAIPHRGSPGPRYAGVLTHASLGVPGGDHPYCPGVPLAHQVQSLVGLIDPSRSGGIVNFTINWRTIQTGIRKVLAYLGVLEGVVNLDHLPTAVRTAIVSVSGALLAVEHYVDRQPVAKP